nr:JAB domain-containing protein [Acetobacterium wieringae]
MGSVSNAASIILFHNHPSGDPEPSHEDISVSKRIKDSGKILGNQIIQQRFFIKLGLTYF